MLYFNGNLFDGLFEDGLRAIQGQMKSDILESKGAYLLSVDIPGAKKEDVSLNYSEGILTISVKKLEDDIKDGEYVSMERAHSACQRSYEFADIDEENIKAKFKDGVLEVVMPKKETKINKKTIEIE